MGIIKKHNQVKLIIGLIFREERQEDTLLKALNILKARFGEIDLQSRPLEFNHTDYYKDELGTNLKRIFLSFKKLIPPERLADIKVFTNKIEKKLSKNKLRKINIDPGYIDLPRLVLASTKNFAHRIYLGKGIYGEITLLWQDKAYKTLDWTFPDYKTKEYTDADVPNPGDLNRRAAIKIGKTYKPTYARLLIRKKK